MASEDFLAPLLNAVSFVRDLILGEVFFLEYLVCHIEVLGGFL